MLPFGWVLNSPVEGLGYPLPVFLGFSDGSEGKKNSPANAGDMDSVP